MANIQLPTGKTINIPIAQFLFGIQDDEVDLFFQNCIADDLGSHVENPFANSSSRGIVQVEDEPEIEEAPLDEIELKEGD
jgi:hypothetical protein